MFSGFPVVNTAPAIPVWAGIRICLVLSPSAKLDHSSPVFSS